MKKSNLLNETLMYSVQGEKVITHHLPFERGNVQLDYYVAKGLSYERPAVKALTDKDVLAVKKLLGAPGITVEDIITVRNAPILATPAEVADVEEVKRFLDDAPVPMEGRIETITVLPASAPVIIDREIILPPVRIFKAERLVKQQVGNAVAKKLDAELIKLTKRPYKHHKKRKVK